MEYFRILNLCREPFSNSPDPELSFRSRQHVMCLQRLELSIRFRRGLNVVIGEVGTGKTTLCRQFVRKVADDDLLETHLILDPSFSSPQEFLMTVSGMFGLEDARWAEYSSWQLKEYIKNYLFRRGIDEQKIVVLIIDEGQKLPDFCLEILREFLNYETNQSKLLQTIIFAQEEFQQTIGAYPNFADRISHSQVLGSMSFRETRQMIRFRLNQAKEGSETPELFSYLGLLAVYRATGGYPRKIIHLCHRVLLALIIRNQSKAGWSLVRWCARMSDTAAPRRRRAQWSPAFAPVCALILILVVTVVNGQWRLPSFLSSNGMQPASVAKTADPHAVAPPAESGLVLSEEDSRPQTQPEPQSKPQPQHVQTRSSSVLRKPVVEGLRRKESVDQAHDSHNSKGQAPDLKLPTLQVPDDQVTGLEAAVSQPSASESPVVGSEEVEGSVASEITDSETADSQQQDSMALASRDEAPPEFDSMESSSEQAEEAVNGASSTEDPPLSASSPTENDFPEILGKIGVRQNERLERMIRKVYGTSDDEHVDHVIRANPYIRNRNHILVGKPIRFPAIPVESASRGDCWYVQVGEKEDLEKAYEVVRSPNSEEVSLRLIPYWNRQKGMRFSVILNQCFETSESALEAAGNLPAPFAGSPVNLAGSLQDTVFFAR